MYAASNSPIFRNGVRSALILLILLLAGPAAAQEAETTPQIEVQPQAFDWVEVDEDSGVVTYEWAADIANREQEDHEVDLVLQLLDEEEGVQHEETVRVAVPGQATEQVESGGTIDLDTARSVVSLRHVVQMAE